MISVALFNNKGGVGKTTLAYHLAHMLARLGHRVLAADLDPQSNLTAAFLDESELALLWHEDDDPPARPRCEPRFTTPPDTIAEAVQPILQGLGDVKTIAPIPITDGLWLLAGDIELSGFEDTLSAAWPRTFTGTDLAAVRATTAFYRVIEAAAVRVDAEFVLVDVGPNLGAINRAALLAADTVLMPLAADLFSLRGLRNLGPTLRGWRRIWQETILPRAPSGIPTPSGRMEPLGYVIMQPSVRLDRPVKAYERWLDRIPRVYATAVLGEAPENVGARSHEIATVRNYRSLMPLAHDARKPMFDLRAADGAIGSTQRYVAICYEEFQRLTRTLVDRLAEVTDDARG